MNKCEGIIIKEACTEKELRYLYYALIESNFFNLDAKRFTTFWVSLLSFPNSKNVPNEVVWVSKGKHRVGIRTSNVHKGVDVFIGSDKSNYFYPKIVTLLDEAILRPYNVGYPVGLKKHEEKTFVKIDDKQLLTSLRNGDILSCKNYSNTYYFYTKKMYKHINLDMLLYGDWYVYA